MNIIEFKNRAIAQDKRNIFGEYNDNVSFIPNDLQKFYISCNPLDVEVSMNENSIKFYPVKELDNLQNDYKLTKNKFIFATCKLLILVFWFFNKHI